MTRHIERQIEHLKERILRVGTLVEEAISRSISAVINRDVSLAQRVMASDEAIDRRFADVAANLDALAGGTPFRNVVMKR